MSDRRDRTPGARSIPRSRLFARIEAMAIRNRERFWAAMPGELARRLRPRTARIGGGFATLMAGSDALRVNRVIGFGHAGRVTERQVDDILDFYREAGIRRFGFELGSVPQFDEIGRWLAERGFRKHGGYTLFVRDLRRPIPPADRRVRVVRATGARLSTSVVLAERIFAVPASRRRWALAAARSGHSRHFLGLVRGTPAAIGALAVEGDLAWLGGGGTLTRFRRRGAQYALIAARLRYARRVGCRRAWSETVAPTPGRPQGSRRNLLRSGFEEAFRKPSFVWGRRR